MAVDQAGEIESSFSFLRLVSIGMMLILEVNSARTPPRKGRVMKNTKDGQELGGTRRSVARRRTCIIISALIALALIGLACSLWLHHHLAASSGEAGVSTQTAKQDQGHTRVDRGMVNLDPMVSPPGGAQSRPAVEGATPSQVKNQEGACAPYQGIYTSQDLGQATLMADCSLRLPDHWEKARQVTSGASGVSAQIPGALQIYMVNSHHAVVYSLFPTGVGAGYPNEDTSHNRLVNNSGGPISAMTYEEFCHSGFVAD